MTALIGFSLYAIAILVTALGTDGSYINVASYSGQTADTLVYISDQISPPGKLEGDYFTDLNQKLNELKSIDKEFPNKVSVHPYTGSTFERLIFSPTGNLKSDTADSRSIYDAAHKAFNLAFTSGGSNLVLYVGALRDAEQTPWGNPNYKQLNAILGALYALYLPIELKDIGHNYKYKSLFVYGEKANVDWAIKMAIAIESGRWLTRDICGSDPERMSTSNILKYLSEVLPDFGLSYKSYNITDEEWPLMAAVNRASKNIPRHDGRVVEITYGKETARDVLLMVGKGITFDTGGADLKLGNAMVGMHRDKCGAAAIIGFIVTASKLSKQNLHIVGRLAFARNNIGARSYITDEIIKSRAGKRIRIANTDAEGRMVMTDLVAQFREEALEKYKSQNVQIFTIATLTGHVIRTYKYNMGAMENGPSKKEGILNKMQTAGNKIADLVEISTLRKEDYDFNLTPLETEDYLQCNPAPSTNTPRGHQFPAAFMMQASRLDEHGLLSEHPIKYVHLDVAGSVGTIDFVPTGSPMTMLASHYLVESPP